MKENKKAFVAGCAVSAVVGAAAMYGGLYISSPEMFRYAEQTKAIAECEKVIAEKGSPDFDVEAAKNGMIQGYLNEGGDKYTYLYNEIKSGNEYTEETTALLNASPTCQGSGLKVDISDSGNILICEVKANSPAQKQGLNAGDEITAINGVSFAEKSYDEYAEKLLGKPDTVVKLTILREGKQFDIDFKRTNADVGEAVGRKYGSVGYIKINSFDDFTVAAVDGLLADFKGITSIIIDLRNCPGGLTDASVRIAGRFIDTGMVFCERFNGDDSSYQVEPYGDFPKVPLVVLINGETMSAAEIMTGLLMNNSENCRLVGEKTFGKGIFQMEEKLESGGTLHYTAGYFRVDDLENWHGVGISPDAEVLMDSSFVGTNDDLQLKKALELLE